MDEAMKDSTWKFWILCVKHWLQHRFRRIQHVIDSRRNGPFGSILSKPYVNCRFRSGSRKIDSKTTTVHHHRKRVNSRILSKDLKVSPQEPTKEKPVETRSSKPFLFLFHFLSAHNTRLKLTFDIPHLWSSSPTFFMEGTNRSHDDESPTYLKKAFQYESN